MQDNTKRGERTLFWLKVLFVLFIFLFFANNTFGESMKSMRQESVGLAVAYIAYGFVCGFGLLISSVMFLVYYFSWLHRAIANLRILTKPDFSPIGAIVLTLIPIIGFVLHFWIFNDMVGCQEKCMEERGILKGRFPKKLLVAWFFATLAVVVLMFKNSDMTALNVIQNLFFVTSIGLYIKFLTFYIAQERELFQYHTETLFRKRVDEAIRERDIQRAADMLREKE
ncbi:hypothetical protein B7990_14365 [Fibrobacter sp. UWB4]|nr:hypothetical protein B7990_14365 [Fibrobacter sp. UWB4]